jgi:hypothetical protein
MGSYEFLDMDYVDGHFLTPQDYAMVRIAGEFVALLVQQRTDVLCARIEIWNWTQAGSSHQVCASQVALFMCTVLSSMLAVDRSNNGRHNGR